MKKLLYVGDISKQDAMVLYKYASRATNILEFGSGASTHVLAHSTAKITSIDTEQTWIDTARQNLKDLELREVDFVLWNNRQEVYKATYDVVFDDGDPTFRKQFFNEVFKSLSVGGKLLAHDTRCPSNWLYEAISDNQNEIDNVVINQDDSNITVVTKGILKPYQNWHLTENRDYWEFAQVNSVKPPNWKEILLSKAPEVDPLV
jgi:predicted O-methyltransferase YrrM